MNPSQKKKVMQEMLKILEHMHILSKQAALEQNKDKLNSMRTDFILLNTQYANIDSSIIPNRLSSDPEDLGTLFGTTRNDLTNVFSDWMSLESRKKPLIIAERKIKLIKQKLKEMTD